MLGLLGIMAISCNTQKEQPTKVESNQPQEKQAIVAKQERNTYGEKIQYKKILTQKEIAQQYTNLKSGDTLTLAFESKVKNVCQAKGCWMKLALAEEENIMVKFKDYGFFVPKDIADKSVVVAGKAYVTEMTVDEQKHFAKDAGKSEEEIAKIITPKKTYSFIANGVEVK